MAFHLVDGCAARGVRYFVFWGYWMRWDVGYLPD